MIFTITMSNQVTPEDFQNYTDKIRETYNNQGLTDERLAELDKELCEFTETKKGKKVITIGAAKIRNPAISRVRHFKGQEPIEEHRITGEMVNTRSPEEIEELRLIVQGLAQAIRKKGK